VADHQLFNFFQSKAFFKNSLPQFVDDAGTQVKKLVSKRLSPGLLKLYLKSTIDKHPSFNSDKKILISSLK